MKGKIWKAALAAAVMLAAGYFLIGNPFIAYNNYRLKQSVLAVSQAETTLNEIVPFQWDAVYTFEPYTPRREIEERIGFQSGAVRETVSEGMVQLLFVKDGRVVSSVCGYAENLGYRIDFKDKIGFQENALFEASRRDNIVSLKEKQSPGLS